MHFVNSNKYKILYIIFIISKTEEDNFYLFDCLKISGAGEKYRSYMGQYPVISISLKSMKKSGYKEAFVEFKNLIAGEV